MELTRFLVGLSAVKIRCHIDRVYFLDYKRNYAAQHDACEHLVTILGIACVGLHLEERGKRVRCRERDKKGVACENRDRRKQEPSVGVERLSEWISNQERAARYQVLKVCKLE